MNLLSLRQALESSSLLSKSYLVIIENLFSGKKNKEKEKIIDYLKKNQPQNLIIWEEKKIDGRLLLSFKNSVLTFDLAPLVFHFLDSFFPGNAKSCLSLFHQCLEQEPSEAVFYLLQKRVEHLIIAYDLGRSGLSKMALWQAEKLIRQAQKFTLLELLKIYRRLLKIDFQQKTGKSSFDLSDNLDLLIANL